MGNTKNNTYRRVNDIRTTVTDQDKVEMAGLGAYLTSEDTHKNGPLLLPNKNDNIYPIKEINGKKFLVENIHNGSITGENYSTWTLVDDHGRPVEPIQTTFVVQGSNALPPSEERDAIDDANLAYRQTPEQYQKTLDAFNKINNEREAAGLPRIKDVVGNSLGGGVANFIGYHTEGVSVISLNPATVPDIPNGDHSDVISVITGDDILNMLQSGMAYQKGGIQYKVSGFGWGTENLNNQSLNQLMNTALVYGHTGYGESRDGSGYQIDNGALATSFLTGNLFVQKSNFDENIPVYIDVNTMRNLVYSLMKKGNEQLRIVKTGLEKINQIAKNENSNLTNRTKEVENFFRDFLYDISLGLLDEKSRQVKNLSDISENMGTFIRSVKTIISPLNGAKNAAWLATKIPLVGDLFKKVEELVEKVEKAVSCTVELPNNILLLLNATSNMLITTSVEIPKLFVSIHSSNDDGIAMAIEEYSSILKDINYPLIEAQYNNYLLTAVEIANVLEAMDSSLANSLTNLNITKTDTSGLQKKLTEVLSTPESIKARKILLEKEQQLDKNLDSFCMTLASKLKYFSEIAYDVLIGIRVTAELIETILNLIKDIVDLISEIYNKEKQLLDFFHAGWIIEPYKQVSDALSDYVQNGIDTLNFLEHSDAYKIGTNILKDLATQDNAYNLFTNMKPIVNIAIFSADNMLSLQLAANASLSLACTLKIEFSGLMNEISEDSCVKGINDLKNGAKEMFQNFQKFEEHLDVLAFD